MVDIAGCCSEVLAGIDEDLLEYISGSIGARARPLSTPCRLNKWPRAVVAPLSTGPLQTTHWRQVRSLLPHTSHTHWPDAAAARVRAGEDGEVAIEKEDLLEMAVQHGLSFNKMALTTSDCGTTRPSSIKLP